MKNIFILLMLVVPAKLLAQTPEENYPVDSASVEHPGVPKGEILKLAFDQSKFFPGTWRELLVYVPAQYDPVKPACVYVNQDGIQWQAPTVFDNLIHQKQMPVTIGIFVTPGRVLAKIPDEALDRYNRSYEYDGLGDNYARFLLEEILPLVENQKTADGRMIRLSQEGNDRAIGGSSSGAVCAFTVAWERPESFSRVFSAIGTYVGLRGADRYPTLVRKYEPKPLRIFMQDGANDLNIYAGDWWMANQTMLRALTFAGYEATHVWGEGGHNGKQGSALFPDAMRYLWKGWPEPIQGGISKNQMLNEILVPNEAWEKAVTFPKSENRAASFKIDKSIVAGGSALSPDQTQLYVTDTQSHWVYISQVQPDRTLRYQQRYGWLHAPDDTENAGAKSLACDREGRVYVATALGVQVLDQTGRVNLVLPVPGGAVTDLAFGGENFSELYVQSGGNVYRRLLKVQGVKASEKPIKPVKPKL